MKHVIQKFRYVEEHARTLDSQLIELKKSIEAHSTVQQLEEVANEIRTKMEHSNKSLAAYKETVSGLESQIERNRVNGQTIDKKLDACVKEKAVQDRLIRETQDALQDKVAVAELNMFEAKFAGYTTKNELQEVVHMLSDYTRIEATERIGESLKALDCQFENYSRTSR